MTTFQRTVMYITSLAILIGMFSCEEDSLNNPVDLLSLEEESPFLEANPAPSFPLFSTIPFGTAYPEANRYFEDYMENVKQNNRSEVFLFDEIDVNNYIVHESAEGTSHVWYLPSTQSSAKTYYNLVFEQYPEGYDEPFILEYNLSDAFHADFNAGLADLNNFSGVVKKYLLNQVLRERSEEFEFCYQLFFGDSGGGHGAYQDGPGTTTTTTSTSSNETIVTSGIGALFGVCLECVECTCASHSCGTGSCNCGENGSGTRWYYVMGKCDNSNLVQGQNDTQLEENGRGILEDCYKVLLECGVMPPGYVSGNPDDEIEEEDCVPASMQFITENRLSFKDLKVKGVKLEECCSEPEPEDCMWADIEGAYGFNFSHEVYVDLVVPVLEEFGWELDHLTNNDVDLNACVDSDNFRSCAWAQLIYATMSESDFDIEEIQYTAENPPQDYVFNFITKDWSAMTEDERLQHAITELRRMAWAHRCHMDGRVGNYRLDEPDGVFSNVSGQGESYTHKADITAKINDSYETIPDIGWGWSIGTGTGQSGIDYQTFRSTLYYGESASFPVWHFYFVRKYASAPIDHLDACMDFTCPTINSSKMYSWFNIECKK